jgi:hypothetical protein
MAVKINEEIFSKLATAIRQAGDKSSKSEASTNEQRIIESNIKAAESRISSAEAQVNRHQMAKKEVEDKLSPPPTKQVQGDGKKAGTLTVVDEREKDKLTAQVRAADVQIQQAQAAVETAREEAEAMKSKTIESAGISQENQQSMAQLSSQISELKALVNDPQTDLTSESFQNKLKKATEDTNSLQAALPNTANAALKSFWDEIGKGFTDIQTKLVDASTPEPATVRKSGADYSGYFQDVDQGFNTIIGHLERNGGTRSQITAITNAHDSIRNEKNNYLGGMTSSDDAKLVKLLTNINSMVNDINQGETIEQGRYDSIIADSKQTTDVLAQNGSNFTDGVISPTFQGIANNLDTIKKNIPNNNDFNSMLTKFESILNEDNDTSKLFGFSKEDYAELDKFYEDVRTIKNKSLSENPQDKPGLGDIRNLTTLGNTTINKLIAKYNLSTGSNGGNTDNSGNGGDGTTRR